MTSPPQSASSSPIKDSSPPIIFDESIDVPDAEEVKSPPASSSKAKDLYKFPENPTAAMSDGKSDDDYDEPVPSKLPGTSSNGMTTQRHKSHLGSLKGTDQDGSDQTENSDDDDDDDEDDDDDDVQAATVEGTYDPADYEHLNVSPEIKDLFQFITRYTPQTIELEYKLKPFIPDFIPAVGDIDAFLKVPRPDNKQDNIGLTVLDEPCAKQSDPAVLDLQLRAVSKQSSAKTVVVKKIESAEKNTKAIDKWIKDISDLHRAKPPPTVHYSKPMPDIDNLMQEWPADFEEQLKEVGLPTADLDCDLGKYVEIICHLFDIPVYESKIQSLHVLFTLYSAIKNSQHFNNLLEQHQGENET